MDGNISDGNISGSDVVVKRSTWQELVEKHNLRKRKIKTVLEVLKQIGRVQVGTFGRHHMDNLLHSFPATREAARTLTLRDILMVFETEYRSKYKNPVAEDIESAARGLIAAIQRNS